MFYLVKAASPHMRSGSAIINTASVNADNPSPHCSLMPLLRAPFRISPVQLLADKGIRVNAVAPGPVWTPLIPSTMPAQHVAFSARTTQLSGPPSPANSGTMVGVTGGKPIL
jgi:NAD(P)-dependent dehydrogenase (short-subunit alcohol dehydrogenase family)